MEQFSVKTNWTLAVNWTQDCKERSTQSQAGREEKQSGWDPTPRRGHRRERGYHGLGDPPWGVIGSSHTLGTPILGSDTRNMNESLTWFEN